MIKVRIIYKDGRFILKPFKTIKDAEMFIYNEGDHVEEYEIVL